MKSINLLSVEYCRGRVLRWRGRAWAQALIVAGAGAALTVAVCQSLAPATSGLQSRRARLDMESEQLLRTASEHAKGLEERRERVELLTRVARQPDLSSLLSLLGRWCVDGVRLESVSVSVRSSSPEFEVRIVGLCVSQDLATVYIECARSSKVFESITLAGTRRLDRPEGTAYRFELRCVLANLREQAEALR